MKTVTSNYNATIADDVILAKSTASTDLTVTLPDAALGSSRELTIKHAGNGRVIVRPATGQKLDGADQYVLPEKYDHVTVISDGEAWYGFDVRVELVNPLLYGAIGNGIIDDSGALNAAAAALGPNQGIDLLGLTYKVNAPITLSNAHGFLCNGKLVGGQNRVLHVTGADAWCEHVSFERERAGSTANVEGMCLVTVNAERFSSRYCDYTITDVGTDSNALACLYFFTGSCNGSRVIGGRMTNASARQNASLIYAAAGTANVGILVSGAILESTGCPDGIILFDAQRCRVHSNEVFGMVELPLKTLSPWTNRGGGVWSAPDRNDGQTIFLFDGGVQKTKTGDTMTPNADEWGTYNGLVYYNKGSNPGGSVTSKIVSGYGITIYVTSGSLTCADNLIDGNAVHDTDGFGIYYQLGGTACVNNQTRGNTLRNVCTNGIQTVSLPFAGIGVAAGEDTLLDGDSIDTTGGSGATASPGVHVANSGSGIARGLRVRGAAGNGIYAQTVGWTFHGCRSTTHVNDFYTTVATVFNSCEGSSPGKIVGGIQINSRGAGSPQSLVTAEVGSEYVRTDGGAGTTHYFKESGSSNTGWVAK